MKCTRAERTGPWVHTLLLVLWSWWLCLNLPVLLAKFWLPSNTLLKQNGIASLGVIKPIKKPRLIYALLNHMIEILWGAVSQSSREALTSHFLNISMTDVYKLFRFVTHKSVSWMFRVCWERFWQFQTARTLAKQFWLQYRIKHNVSQ